MTRRRFRGNVGGTSCLLGGRNERLGWELGGAKTPGSRNPRLSHTQTPLSRHPRLSRTQTPLSRNLRLSNHC